MLSLCAYGQYGDGTDIKDPVTSPIGVSFETLIPQHEPIDYEAECVGKFLSNSDMPGYLGLVNKIDEIVKNSNNNYKIGNSYLLCFSEEVYINIPNNIPRYDQRVIIYGLKPIFTNNIVMNPNISTDGNIDFVNVHFSGDSETLFIIKGSDVKIIDSIIESKKIGISIGSSEIAKISNIKVENSHISGPTQIVLNSIGIDINNADNVIISENDGGISNFAIGVKYANSTNVRIINNTYSGVEAFIDGAVGQIVTWDKVGKVIKEITTLTGSGEIETVQAASRIAGLLPTNDANVCNESDVVELYKAEPGQFVPIGQCSVMQLKDDETLCLYHADEDIPVSEEELNICLASGECECHIAGACIFDCLGLDIPIYKSIAFAYTGSEGSTNTFSETKIISTLKNIREIATGAPGVDLPTAEQGAVGEDNVPDYEYDEDDVDGDNVSGAGMGGGLDGTGFGDVKVAAPGNLDSEDVGKVQGCSLSQTTNITWHPIALLLVLIGIFFGGRLVCVKVPRSRRRTRLTYRS